MRFPKTILPESARMLYRLGKAWLLSIGLSRSKKYVMSGEEMGASVKISIVIPVHDSPEDVQRCVQSLEAYAGCAEVIFVNDGSRLHLTQEILAQACHRNAWKIVNNAHPVGHSRASEAGVQIATKDIICLLNSDTVVTQHSWLGVVRAFDVSPKIAIVGPSTSWTPSPQRVARAEHCRHYWTNQQIWSFADRYVRNHGKEQLTDLSTAGGFALFVRRTTWDSLKGFDENLPDYGNETEFCQRARIAGYRVVWTKQSYIHHLGSKSYGQTLGMAAVVSRRRAASEYIKTLRRARTP